MNYYFITGTSRGLGKALAEKILALGNSKVIGISRASTIINPNYSHHSLDLKNVKEIEIRAKQIFTSLIEPEKIVLINNSGTLGEVKYVGETNADNIIDVLNINTIAPAILMNCFIQQYIKAGCPRKIVNISSGAGKNAIDGWSNYCTSKAALDMFSSVAALEQEKRNADMKIYSISPGIIDTTMQDRIRKSDPENFSMIDKFLDYKKDSALSTPKEIADKFIWFLSNENQFDATLLDVRNF